MGVAQAAPTAEEWAATAPTDAEISSATTSRQLLDLFVRCRPMGSGLQYCLHQGWSQEAAGQTLVDTMLETAVANAGVDAATGGEDLVKRLQTFSQRSADDRNVAELSEINDAESGFARLAEREDRLRRVAAGGMNSQACVPNVDCDPPTLSYIMTMNHYRQQETQSTCGSAVARMGALWVGVNLPESDWTRVVYQSGNGSSWDIRYAWNQYAGWYGKGDPYQVYNPYSENDLMLHVMGDVYYNPRRPMSVSVMLDSDYFSYLINRAGSKHFELLRGYDKYNWNISNFEPYNWRTWDSTKPATGGEHWVHGRSWWLATQANGNNLVY